MLVTLRGEGLSRKNNGMFMILFSDCKICRLRVSKIVIQSPLWNES